MSEVKVADPVAAEDNAVVAVAVDKVTVAVAEDIVTVAIPIAAPDELGEKQGSKCCSCCCDMRRAVIVLAIIGIVVNAVGFTQMLYQAISLGITSGTPSADSDPCSSGYYGFFAFLSVIVAIGFAIGIGLFVFKLFAALKYNLCMLTTVLVFNFLELVFGLLYAINIYGGNTGQLIVAIIVVIGVFSAYIYPVIGLIREIESGIMSEETYAREFYSCCCQRQV